MMNIAIADPTIPEWVPFSVALLGTAVPLAVAAVPIARATRITIASALAHHGKGSDFVRPSPVRLPLAIRNALRRPARLVVTLLLLVTGGGLVMGAANVERGLMRISSKLAAARRYDLDIPPAPARSSR
jgi:putative ABC transport system permease protein